MDLSRIHLIFLVLLVLKGSHSEHLEEEILNLRNALLKVSDVQSAVPFLIKNVRFLDHELYHRLN